MIVEQWEKLGLIYLFGFIGMQRVSIYRGGGGAVECREKLGLSDLQKLKRVSTYQEERRWGVVELREKLGVNYRKI